MKLALSILVFCQLLLSSASTVSVNAQAPQFSTQSVVHHDNGVEISSDADTLRIDALRPDVLRVRLYPVGHPAEDASWAVLSEARTAHVAVTPTDDGFKTSSLIVHVSSDLKLTVIDLAGNVLQTDAALR
jgi:alpha-glucosidase